jgi:hypothetical protein
MSTPKFAPSADAIVKLRVQLDPAESVTVAVPRHAPLTEYWPVTVTELEVSGTLSDPPVLAVSEKTTLPAPSKFAEPVLWNVPVNCPEELTLRPVRTREQTPVRVDAEHGAVLVSVRSPPMNITTAFAPVMPKFDPFDAVTINCSVETLPEESTTLALPAQEGNTEYSRRVRRGGIAARGGHIPVRGGVAQAVELE